MSGSSAPSRFHEGEKAVQARVGVRDKMDRYGEMAIRDFLPEQHRAFYPLLPLFLVGSIDDHGRPWASPLVGAPGFLSSPDPQRLRVEAWPADWDPWAKTLTDGSVLGGLGLEFPTRRRNRINGRAKAVVPGRGFEILVDQTFGNCPQYIQARKYEFVSPQHTATEPVVGEAELSAPVIKLIERADTLFIATAFGVSDGGANHGVDVSHRGGLPGFASLTDRRTIRIPDYRGNFFFNTLGNLTAYPRCGLLFIDFGSGDVVQVTGDANILWDVREEDARAGALRSIELKVQRWVYVARALPLVWDFLSFAPQFDGRRERPSPSS